MAQSGTWNPSVTPPPPLTDVGRSREGAIIVEFILLLLDHGNDWQSPQKMKKNENQDFMGVSISKCQLKYNVPILGVIVSTFDIYLAFLNANEM